MSSEFPTEYVILIVDSLIMFRLTAGKSRGAFRTGTPPKEVTPPRQLWYE